MRWLGQAGAGHVDDNGGTEGVFAPPHEKSPRDDPDDPGFVSEPQSLPSASL